MSRRWCPKRTGVPRKAKQFSSPVGPHWYRNDEQFSPGSGTKTMEVKVLRNGIGRCWPTVLPTPVAVWNDDAHGHFLALASRPRSGAPPKFAEIVEYQTLCPRRGSFVPGLCFRFHLPVYLATVEVEESWERKKREFSRRVPLLAKLSLDRKVLAVQFSETLIRIIPLESDNHSDKQHQPRHWTIDFSAKGTEPIISHGQAYHLPRYYQPKESAGKDCLILKGGLIWSDHGGNSQDLVVVTTNLVVCYKVSLRRNCMTSTHTFQHPRASSVWWEPVTRTVMVGSSLGPVGNDRQVGAQHPVEKSSLQVRTYALRFPPNDAKRSTRLPRLELPPPRRFPVFEFRPGGRQQNGLDTDWIQLLCLYGNAYAVQMLIEDLSLRVKLHRLDPTRGSTLVADLVADGIRPTREQIKPHLVLVLDNVLFIAFENSQLLLVDLDPNGLVHSVANIGDALAYFNGPSLSVAQPCVLQDSSGNGDVAFVKSDSDKLFALLKTSPHATAFFMRRGCSDSRRFALSSLKYAIEHFSPVRRYQVVRVVVKIYASSGVAMSLDWDEGSLLTFGNALLSPGRVLRRLHHGIEHSKPTELSPMHVICQTDILGYILIPNATNAIDNQVEKDLEDVLEIAIEIIEVLDRHNVPACPSLECFVASLLIRQGDAEEFCSFLKSRTKSLGRQGTGRERRDVYTSPSVVVDMGALALVQGLLGITAWESASHEARWREPTARVICEKFRLRSARFLHARISDNGGVARHLRGSGICLDPADDGYSQIITLIEALHKTEGGEMLVWTEEKNRVLHRWLYFSSRPLAPAALIQKSGSRRLSAPF